MEVLIVNGAIASGKNAVSTALAALLERDGRRVAVIDLDEIWFMVDHQVPRTHGFERWLIARRGAAALTDAFFSAGLDTVIVNGPFFTDAERDGYLSHLRTSVDPVVITLRVSFEESWRRAQGDPDPRRVTSRDRAWLAQHHAASETLLGPVLATDIVVDTDRKAAAQVAAEILTQVKLRERRGSQRGQEP